MQVLHKCIEENYWVEMAAMLMGGVTGEVRMRVVPLACGKCRWQSTKRLQICKSSNFLNATLTALQNNNNIGIYAALICCQLQLLSSEAGNL